MKSSGRATGKKSPASLRKLSAPKPTAGIDAEDSGGGMPGSMGSMGAQTSLQQPPQQPLPGMTSPSQPSTSAIPMSPPPTAYDEGGDVDHMNEDQKNLGALSPSYNPAVATQMQEAQGIDDSVPRGGQDQTGTLDINALMGDVMDTLNYGRQKNGLGGGSPQSQAQGFADGGNVVPFKRPTQEPTLEQLRAKDTNQTLSRALGGTNNVLPMTPQGSPSNSQNFNGGGDVDPVKQMQGAADDESAAYGPDNNIQQSTQTPAQGAIPAPDDNAAGASNAAGGDASPQNQSLNQVPSIAGYLKGADAAPGQAVQQAEAQTDPDGTKSEDMRRLLAIANAPDQDTKWSILQHYRQKYDAYKAFATAAITGVGNKAADMGAATKAAMQAYSNIPDGSTVDFQPLPNGVTATVKQGHIVKAAPVTLSWQQFTDFLKGKEGQFDNVLRNGLIPALQKVASTASSAVAPGAPTQQNMANRFQPKITSHLPQGMTPHAPAPQTPPMQVSTPAPQPQVPVSQTPAIANPPMPQPRPAGAPQAIPATPQQPAPSVSQGPLQLPKGYSSVPASQGITVGKAAANPTGVSKFANYVSNLSKPQGGQQQTPVQTPPTQPQGPPKAKGPFGGFDQDIVDRITSGAPTYMKNNKEFMWVRNNIIAAQNARDAQTRAVGQPQKDPFAKEKEAARLKFLATNPSDEDVATYDKRQQTPPAQVQTRPQPTDIQYLKAHPEFKAQFEARFGPGTAAMVLGGQ